MCDFKQIFTESDKQYSYRSYHGSYHLYSMCMNDLLKYNQQRITYNEGKWILDAIRCNDCNQTVDGSYVTNHIAVIFKIQIHLTHAIP